MWPDKRLTDLLGIEHPIIQAPMVGASTPAMAAASTNAGCLGSLGCAMLNSEAYSEYYQQTKALTDGPINVNFFCHSEPELNQSKIEKTIHKLASYYQDFGIAEIPEAVPIHYPFAQEMMEVVVKSNPAVVSFHFGLPSRQIMETLKAHGIKILSTATTVSEAIHLEANGVDAIIAQGWEAGGHHGFYLGANDAAIGTMALVPQLVDAVNVPIIAAGGIADGRGIAAAFALGAAGVQIGTAFITCKESSISQVHHHSIMNSKASDTAMTSAFSGRPARGILNKYMIETKEIENDLPDFPLLNTLTGPLRKASADKDNPDFVAQWAGQALGLNKETTVQTLIESLCQEAQDIFEKLSKGN